MNNPNLMEAISIIELINKNTTCPDPGYGGCIGGLIPGYGCINEATRCALRRLLDLKKELESINANFSSLS